MRGGVKTTPRPEPRRPAPPGAVRPRRALTFRQTLVRVALAHLAVLLLLVFWRLPASKPAAGEPMEFIALPGPETPSSAGSAPPAPEPAPAPAPEPPPPPQPQPPSQPPPPPAPEPAPEPTPAPAPVQPPSQIVLPPKPKAAPKPKPAKPPSKPAKAAPAQEEEAEEETPPAPAKPAKPAPRRPKIDLTREVTRGEVVPGARSPAAPAARTPGAGGRGTGLQASGVANRLSQALQGSGADARIVIGPPGGGGGGGGGNQGYYEIIRRQMYGAWNQPVELAGQHLRAQVEIRVAKDGAVSRVSLVSGSGNAAFDASALAAARAVGRIEKPRPDDVPEKVTINFQLVE